MKPRAREPGGYRIMARRLARDLERCIDADKRASSDDEEAIATAEYDRRFAQAQRTLQRFKDYEATHRSRQ